MWPELLVKTLGTIMEPTLQDDTILLALTSYEVKWEGHFTCHLGSATLDFTNFFKKQEILEIDTKWSINAHEMYKFLNSYNLLKNTVKITGLCKKKMTFGQTCKQFVDAMATSKLMDTRLAYQNFLGGWINIYWKFQPMRAIVFPPCTPDCWTDFSNISFLVTWICYSHLTLARCHLRMLIMFM